MHRTIKASCLVVSFGFLASAAHADSVSLTFDGISGNYGQNIGVSLSGGYSFADGASSKNIWAGQLSYTADGETIRTFCTELTQWAASGEYDIVDVADAPSSGPMGAAKADAIYRLFNATNGAADIDTNAEAAAFQAVIWEIVYDFDTGMNFTGGNVQFTGLNNSLVNLFAGYANDTQGDSTPNVIAYSNQQYQDQLGVQVVPLPGAAMMAGLGLAGMATRRRRG